MPRYIDTIYDPKLRPLTSYPDQLARYLYERFDFKQGHRLLDLGCGRGDFGKAFQKLGLEVEGADMEATTSNIIGGMPVKFFNIETDAYPYPDNYFDVIFSKSVTEHVHDPKKFFEEQKRILKPGGRIIVMTPDWVSQIKIFWNDYTHKRPYTVLGLKNVLNIFGYKNVSSEIFYQYPLYWRYPQLKIIAWLLKITGPVTKLHKNKLYRWSKELMLLGTGTK